MPSSEEAFINSQPTPGKSLKNAIRTRDASALSPFAALLVMTAQGGARVLALRRFDHDLLDCDAPWTENRWLDTMLTGQLSVPAAFLMQPGIHDPNIFMLQLATHTSNICTKKIALDHGHRFGAAKESMDLAERQQIQAAEATCSVLKMAFEGEYRVVSMYDLRKVYGC